MRVSTIALALALALGFTACNNNQSPTPEQVRQKTADATATLKNDAQALGQGVRDGLSRPSSDKPVDLNHASKASLLALPGMDDATADRIIAGRPYTSEHQLLEKHIVSRDEYNKIADTVTVSP
jgi:DNA uptake protein ComE-like DNA-binding protein